MKALYAIGLMTLSFGAMSAQTTEVWGKGSVCEAKQVDDIKMREYRTLRGPFRNPNYLSDTSKHMKRALLARLQKEYAEHDKFVLKSTSSYKQGLSEATHGKNMIALEVRAEFTPVVQCAEGDKITAENLDGFSNFALVKYSHTSTAEHTVELKLDTTDSPRRLTRLDGSILSFTENSVLGMTLGTHYDQFIEQIGRPSLDWQVGPRQRVSLVGRYIALFFQDGQLVGYQYNDNLLPMSLSNELEFFDQQESVKLNVDNAEISLRSPISSESQQAALKTDLKLDVESYKKTDTVNEDKLVGVSVGEVFTLVTPKPLSCLDFSTKNVDLSGRNVIRFYNQKSALNVLTGCNQTLELASDGSVNRVNLRESFSLENTALSTLEALLLQQQPWQFAGLKHTDNVEKLAQKGTVSRTKREAEFDSKNWYGFFSLVDNKVVSGSLISH
ncbi:hypothetical protein PALB_22720 [Pseudoalteromonas luteoviolacea B = ATCC 29581]|nr:hypothetical protein PALB_22720 [Pseudoalteromonas luteoviolacea B = ATCC 29581]